MSEDLKHLEYEVERQLAELAPALEVEPPPAVIERTRAAVVRALNEAWLDSQPTPAPDADVLLRVRSAMHRELAGTVISAQRVKHSRRMLKYAWPAVAAAAVIAISVSVFRDVGSSRQVTGVDTDQADQTVDLFVQAAKQVWTEDSLIVSLRMDLDSIEESLFTRSQTSSDGVEEIIEDIESRLDELFIEPDALERTSRVYRVQSGAIG